MYSRSVIKSLVPLLMLPRIVCGMETANISINFNFLFCCKNYLPLLSGSHRKSLLAIEMVVPRDGANADGRGRGRCEGKVEWGSGFRGLRAGSRGRGSLQHLSARLSQLTAHCLPMASVTHPSAEFGLSVPSWSGGKRCGRAPAMGARGIWPAWLQKRPPWGAIAGSERESGWW